jgi:hypothetical protein
MLIGGLKGPDYLGAVGILTIAAGRKRIVLHFQSQQTISGR